MIKIKNTKFEVSCIGKNKYFLKGKVSMKYLLLPIEDKASLVNMTLVVNNELHKQLKVRLAKNQTEYYVPFDISEYLGEHISIFFDGIEENSACWESIEEVDKYDRANRERFRPIFHFSPEYGWMNDPNGMFYKDGVYHLYFQYNPYGSTWENMSWGHATSKDLIKWTHEPVVLQRDGLGEIFSGSAIVDKYNDAGFGKDAIIAFYTNAGIGQMQCLAYSLDDGKTFIKYKNNPILTSTITDFRDPKVFWHKETKKWIMLLAVDQHMEIYSSLNLLNWQYESSFGENEGAHGGVWECPDLVQLPIEDESENRWVLICNINPGGPFGGSATQYFVGRFDGNTFVNDSPLKTKWMDFGKDFYATVTWSNAPDNRAIALGWMSNWQYANQLPTQQFRSANSIPRDLILFRENNEVYLKSTPVTELNAFSRKRKFLENIVVNREYEMKDIFPNSTPAYSLEIELLCGEADTVGIELFNDKDEAVIFTIDIHEREFRMNRSKSGLTDFDPSDTFTNNTISPLYGGCETISLLILVDRCSIDIFGNGGKFAMTNLVFPQEPYNHIRFFSKGGIYTVSALQLNEIEINNIQ